MLLTGQASPPLPLHLNAEMLNVNMLYVNAIMKKTYCFFVYAQFNLPSQVGLLHLKVLFLHCGGNTHQYDL